MEHMKQKNFESCAHQIHSTEPDSKSPSPGVPVAPIETPEKNPEQREIEGNQCLMGIKLVMLVSAVTLVNFLTLLDLTIIVTAIPSITSQFHSLQDLGWYGSAYQISGACLQPLTGKIYTHFSLKWTYLSFLSIFGLASLLCAIATSSKMLIIARATAGLGSAGLNSGALTILSISVPLQKSPVSQLGHVIGPLLGGALTEYTTWRWCFYINLPILVIALLLTVFIHIPDHATKVSRESAVQTNFHMLDLVGFVLFAPASIQLLLALDYGGSQYSWDSAIVVGLFCGAGGAFIIFLLWEYHKGDSAMIPLSMVSKPIVWSSCLMLMSLFGMTISESYYLPIYFQAIRDDSPMMSGVFMLPSILSQLIFAILSGVSIEKLGYYWPWGVFCAVIASIGNGLISTWKPDTPTARWIGEQILVGVGRGAGFQLPVIAVQNTLPPSQIPVAMAVLMFFQTLSGAVWLTIADSIFSSGLKSLMSKHAPDVNPKTIIDSGAGGIRNVVTGHDLIGVLKAYCESVNHVFYMTTALGACCILFVPVMGWKNIRNKPCPIGQA
ncbi:unnamed protein product [Penicillium salamii]|nr:unnamed protein product [Penicillium salamii]CAG8278787.1 unnamed protein product [Penicillium salamii]